jgi:hypothetical protein
VPPANAPEQDVSVKIVNAHFDPEQPVPRAQVSLTFLDSSTLVTGVTGFTNSKGEAYLRVSQQVASRGDLCVKIDAVSGLVVFEPAGGQLSGLPASMIIRLVPKGSPLLLGPSQIEAMLHRLSLENKHLEEQNREMTKEKSAAQNPKQDDLSSAMTAWADANGLTMTDVDAQVKEWAEKIQQSKAQATDEQKALAELALKHYAAAGQLFDQVADDIGDSMDEQEKQELEESRTMLHDLVDRSFQSANAYQLSFQYLKATQVLVKARDRAAKEHHKYPGDAALRGIWMETVERAADARVEQGAVGPSDDATGLLKQSVADYQQLLAAYSLPADQEGWAKTESNLGFALDDRGERSSGTEQTDLFDQAVKAFEAALTVQTKAGQTQDWARTENDLGKAKWYQGERGSGPQVTSLFAEAEKDLRAALDAESKTAQALQWATTENNLGEVLRDQAERGLPAQAIHLFEESAAAHRAALGAETQADMPEYWAVTQMKLGYALTDEAFWSNPVETQKLLAEALAAYQASQQARTKEAVQQDWAMTQVVIAEALTLQSELTSGTQARAMLEQAVADYQTALDVYKKENLPQAWPWVETNLGYTLVDEGEASGRSQAMALFAQAVESLRGSRDMYPRTELPHAWAISENNLGRALADQGELSSGAQAAQLFAEAVEAEKGALEVRTRDDLPLFWSASESNLGRALADQDDAAGATKALDASLEIFSDNFRLLRDAEFTYQNRLNLYDRAWELAARRLKVEPSPAARLSMAEADLATHRFADCEKQSASIEDTAFPAPAAPMILIRDSMKMACEWAGGEKSAAEATEQALVSKSAGLEETAWRFDGTLHFLAASPDFASGRAAWIDVFQSLDKGDGAAMAAALRQIGEVMKN